MAKQKYVTLLPWKPIKDMIVTDIIWSNTNFLLLNIASV